MEDSTEEETNGLCIFCHLSSQFHTLLCDSSNCWFQAWCILICYVTFECCDFISFHFFLPRKSIRRIECSPASANFSILDKNTVMWNVGMSKTISNLVLFNSF